MFLPPRASLCNPETQLRLNQARLLGSYLRSAGDHHMLKPIALFALVACLGGCAVAPGYGYYGYPDPYETGYAAPYYYGHPSVYGGGIYLRRGWGGYHRHFSCGRRDGGGPAGARAHPACGRDTPR